MQKRIIFAFLCILSSFLAHLSLQAQNRPLSSQPYSPPESFSTGGQEISIWQNDYYPLDYYPLVMYFPINEYQLKRDYRNNATMLAALDEMLATGHIIENIDTIEILGACSPTGSAAYNHKLSYNRCLSLRSYIEREHPQIAAKFPIQLNYIGIDYLGYNILSQKKTQLSEKEKWNMLQYSAIRLKMNDGSYLIPGGNYPKPAAVPEVKEEAKEEQQNVALSNIVYLKPDTIYIRDTITIVRDTVLFVPTPEQPATASLSKRPVFVALKTNLLYDATLLPNLSAEVYLGKNWSLVAEGNWSWWTFDKPVQNNWFHRIQAGGVELRYWVKSPYPLNGHAIGVYSMLGNYDVRMFTKNEDTPGYVSPKSWSAGLSYGYSMPIANRFNLEFGVAFGYVGGTYYKYDYCMRHEQWEKGTHDHEQVYKSNYFGPTRVGVSLVWLLGTGNNAKSKEKYTMWQNRKKSNVAQTNFPFK